MLYAEAQALAEFCRAEARNLRRTAAQFGNDPDFIRMAEAWDRDAIEWEARGAPPLAHRLSGQPIYLTSSS